MLSSLSLNSDAFEVSRKYYIRIRMFYAMFLSFIIIFSTGFITYVYYYVYYLCVVFATSILGIRRLFIR